MASNLATALDYAARGFNVIPIRSDDRKRPALDHWKPYREQRVTERELQRWFGRAPCGIAAICGRISDGLTVVDIDDVELAARFLQANPGLVESTLCARTGGGNLHVYVRAPDPPQKFTLRREGFPIDVQAEGAYAVMPPSLHASGRRYAWLPGCGQQVLTILSFDIWLQNALGRAGITWLPRATRIKTDQPLPESSGATDAIVALLRSLTGEAGQLRGNEVWFRCPLHQESVASLSANVDKGVWYCFGCEAGGGISRLRELANGR